MKRTGRDLSMLPKTVIYDPELTFSLPAAVSGPVRHERDRPRVEALYAQDANPISLADGRRRHPGAGASLPVRVRAPEHLEARSEALYGAWLGGAALAAVGMGLHHKLCHVLGGSFDLPHAEVHTIVLPHATAYNREGAPAAMARIAQALGAEDAAAGLFDLAAALGATRAWPRDRPARIGPGSRRRPRRREPLSEPDPAHPRRHPRPPR